MNDRELTREPTVDGARRTQLSACDEERSRQIGALTSGLMPGRRGGESCDDLLEPVPDRLRALLWSLADSPLTRSGGATHRGRFTTASRPM